MPVPHVSGSFADLLDPRFQRIVTEEKKQLRDMVFEVYNDIGTNGRNEMKSSNTGTLGDFTPWGGTVDYGSINQGYDVTSTPLRFSRGVQVERELFEDDQYHLMDKRPVAMVHAANRRRQKDASRIFTQAFGIDTLLYNHTETVGLCSNAHTTTSGASTANGFDNLVTTAMSTTAVRAARIQMVGFRGDQAERISVTPDELWYPPDLYEKAWEIVHSAGQVDTAQNNVNVHQGQYTLHEWNYLSDTNDWFMCDSAARRQNLHWTDRIPLEFAMIEDFDTMVAKWRGTMRYSNFYEDWRFILGAQVS